jgi:sarcosine oxidase subunit alpha
MRELLPPGTLDSFRFMDVADMPIAGVPGRLFGVSFTGETGFEINVPSRHGRALWDAVAKAGAAFGITPYGTEAMHVLRAEKGFIIVGQDSDGTATPDDLGLGWAIGKGKADFIGKRSLSLADLKRPGRRQLVGLRIAGAAPALPPSALPVGAQIVAAAGEKRSLGFVTSSYDSSVLGHPIALAMLENGRARMGETLVIPLPGRDVMVKVRNPIWIGKNGETIDD